MPDSPLMTWPDALAAMKAGAQVARKDSPGDPVYMRLVWHDDRICYISRRCFVPQSIRPSPKWEQAADWITLPPIGVRHAYR